MDNFEIEFLCNLNNSNFPIKYFIDYHNNNDFNDEQNKIIFSYFTTFISNELDIEGTQVFLENLYNDSICNKFMDKWFELNTHDSKYMYNLLILLLQNIHECSNNIAIAENITNNNEIDMIRYKLTNKIWSYQYFRNLIKLAPKLDTGYDYLDNGIFCSLFKKTKWYNKLDIVITNALENIINDKSIHNDLIANIWDMFNVNISYTLNNVFVVSDKECSPVYFTYLLLKLIFEIIDIYKIDDIILNITNDSNIYNIKEYQIDTLPFFHKLYITALYGISISHISLHKMLHNYSDELKHLEMNDIISLLINSSVKNRKQQIITLKSSIQRIEEILKQSPALIQCIYYSYEKIYTKIVMQEIFNDILTYIDYVSLNPNFNMHSKLLEFSSNIMGGLNNNVTNKHVRYYAAEIIFKLSPVLGYNSFGNILNNIFHYLNEVDFFKWSMISKAVIHHKNIQQMLIIILDNYKNNSNIEQLESSITGTLFNIIKNALDMYTYLDELIDQINSQTPVNYRPVSRLSKEMKDVCVELMNNVEYALVITTNIFKQNLIANKYLDVEQELSIFIIHNIEKLSRGSHFLYTLVRRPDLAQSILTLTYDIIAIHLSDEMLENFVNHKDLILETIDSISFDNDEKQKIKDKFNSYVHNEINDYPDEFLDPITCSAIENPVMIPNNNNFFDKTTILMQLRHEKINPYTKEPLTEEILNEHNKKQEIQILLNDFLDKKKEWILKNKS